MQTVNVECSSQKSSCPYSAVNDSEQVQMNESMIYLQDINDKMIFYDLMEISEKNVKHESFKEEHFKDADNNVIFDTVQPSTI